MEYKKAQLLLGKTHYRAIGYTFSIAVLTFMVIQGQ